MAFHLIPTDLADGRGRRDGRKRGQGRRGRAHPAPQGFQDPCGVHVQRPQPPQDQELGQPLLRSEVPQTKS